MAAATTADGPVRTYACAACGAVLATHDDLVSKAFQGRHGRAYLFRSVTNCTAGAPQERTLMTGVHVVADLTCNTCRALVGWTYVRALDESQRYKEGKSILESGRILKQNGWDT